MEAKHESTTAQLSPRKRTKAGAESLRAKAIARVKLCEYEGSRAHMWRGLLSQIRQAAKVPAQIHVDEAARKPVVWSDAEDRRCVLRPYATHQWELVTYWLPHEQAEKARQIEEKRKQESERNAQTYKAEREARIIEDHAKQWPKSVEDFKGRVESMTEVLSALEKFAAGGVYAGCRIDDDSLEEIRDSFASIKRVLSQARYTFNQAVQKHLLVRAHSLRASVDDEFQGFLQQIGAKLS